MMLRSILALLVLVTSVGTGVARGSLPPAGAIVICSGHTTVTILIDAAGNEVEVPTLCGEAAVGLFAQGGVAGPDLGAPLLQPTQLDRLPESLDVVATLSRSGWARGPPWSV